MQLLLGLDLSSTIVIVLLIVFYTKILKYLKLHLLYEYFNSKRPFSSRVSAARSVNQHPRSEDHYLAWKVGGIQLAPPSSLNCYNQFSLSLPCTAIQDKPPFGL